MLGESRLFKAAFELNMATRRSRFGPIVARLAYWLWDTTLDTYFALRSMFRGYVAEFNLFGIPVLLDLRDRSITRALYIFREYEPLQTRMLIHLLEPGMTVIDIGANTGYYTIIAALTVGEKGKIIAFEPYPDNVEILTQNIALNNLKNVLIEECAISDQTSEMILYLSSINAGDHRLYDGKDDNFYNAGRPRKQMGVATLTIDDYLVANEMSVDFIKMDIQGAEYHALQGMKETLQANQDVIMMTEYWPHGLERCGAQPFDFLRELDGLGFKIYKTNRAGGLKPLSLQEAHASVSMVDSLTFFFARRDLG